MKDGHSVGQMDWRSDRGAALEAFLQVLPLGLESCTGLVCVSISCHVGVMDV